MGQITYADKSAINVNPDIADTNKVNAADMNEIKTEVNDNYSKITGVQGEIVWTNSNPTSNFGAQSVNLTKSLDTGDCYEIFCRQSTGNGRIISSGKVPVGHGTFIANPLSLNQYRGTAENTSGSTISFTAGYSANPDGSFTENNSLVIPMYIIGYKTNLFS